MVRREKRSDRDRMALATACGSTWARRLGTKGRLGRESWAASRTIPGLAGTDDLRVPPWDQSKFQTL